MASHGFRNFSGLMRKSPKTTPHKADEKHATVVAWYVNKEGKIFLLIGKESTYHGYEKIPDGPQAGMEDRIRAELRPGERFVIRQKRSDPSIKGYTRQSINEENPNYGFPKGGEKPQDDGNELNIAVREFKEEIGHTLRPGNLKRLRNVESRTLEPINIHKSAIFLYRVNDEEKEEIEREIDELERQRKGEMFDAEFLNLTELRRIYDNKKMNSISKQILDYLSKYKFNMTLFESICPPRAAGAGSGTFGRGGSRKIKRNKTKKNKTRVRK